APPRRRCRRRRRSAVATSDRRLAGRAPNRPDVRTSPAGNTPPGDRNWAWWKPVCAASRARVRVRGELPHHDQRFGAPPLMGLRRGSPGRASSLGVEVLRGGGIEEPAELLDLIGLRGVVVPETGDRV